MTLKFPEEITYKIKKEESDELERVVTMPYDDTKDYISLPECDENEIITFSVPFVSEKLLARIEAMNAANEKKVIKVKKNTLVKKV